MKDKQGHGSEKRHEHGKYSTGTLTEHLANYGITHERNAKTDITGKRTLKKAGKVIGEYRADEAWEKFKHGAK